MVSTINIVLDFEMNPVPSKFRKNDRGKSLSSEIIEIGAVMLDGDYLRKDEFSCLIRPSRNDKIEKKITRLTGITFEDVAEAAGFEEALQDFISWVMEGRDMYSADGSVCVYSWSWSDLHQLRNECEFKNVVFPEMFENWYNFQEMFPEITDIHLNRQISLEYAAQLADLGFDDVAAHRAAYDADITGELVRIVMTGEYRTRMAKVRNVLKSDIEHSTFTLSDKFGVELMALFDGSQDEQN